MIVTGVRCIGVFAHGRIVVVRYENATLSGARDPITRNGVSTPGVAYASRRLPRRVAPEPNAVTVSLDAIAFDDVLLSVLDCDTVETVSPDFVPSDRRIGRIAQPEAVVRIVGNVLFKDIARAKHRLKGVVGRIAGVIMGYEIVVGGFAVVPRMKNPSPL